MSDCVDLGESFQTSIYLILLAKIGVDTAENEPLEVWGGKYSILFTGVLTQHAIYACVFH